MLRRAPLRILSLWTAFATTLRNSVALRITLAFLACQTAWSDVVVFPPDSVAAFLRDALGTGQLTPSLLKTGHSESEQSDGSWCPSKPGYYVAWANNLTAYWFGPFAQAEDMMPSLASFRELKKTLEAIYPKGTYREAHFLPFALTEQGCVQPSLYLQSGSGGTNRKLVEKAYFDWTEAKAQEWSDKLKSLRACLAEGNTPADCSAQDVFDPGQTIDAIHEIKRGIWGDIQSITESSGDGRGGPLNVRAGQKETSEGGDSDPNNPVPNAGQTGKGTGIGGVGETGPPTDSRGTSSQEQNGDGGKSKTGAGGPGADAEGNTANGDKNDGGELGGSAGGSDDGGGILPGSAPKWVQNGARIAAQYFGLAKAEYLLVALYMLAPELVADIAKVVGDATKDLLPKDVADALGKVSDVARLAQQVSASIQAIQNNPTAMAILKEIDKNPLTNAQLKDVAKKAGIGVEALEHLDLVRKALKGEVAVDKLAKDLEAKAKVEGERWLRVALAKELEKAGLPDVTGAAAALLGGDKTKVARELLAAGAKRSGLDGFLNKTVLDDFQRGDLAQMGQHLRQAALQEHLRTQLPWLDDPDQRRHLADALQTGNLREAWRVGTQAQLSSLPDVDRAIIGKLLDGRPQEAKREALHEALRKSGIHAATARALAENGDVLGSVNTEVYQLTGVTAADWRLYALRGINQGDINIIREKLREVPQFRALATRFGERPDHLSEDIDELFKTTEHHLTSAIKNAGQLNVGALADFRGARGQLEERAIETIIRQVTPTPMLGPDDLLRLQKESDTKVAREVLERSLGTDALLRAGLDRSERKQQELVANQFATALSTIKDTAGAQLFDAEQQLFIQKADASAVVQQIARRGFDTVGLRNQTAQGLALDGNVGQSISIEVQDRIVTGEADFRASLRRLDGELTDLRGLQKKIKPRIDGNNQ